MSMFDILKEEFKDYPQELQAQIRQEAIKREEEIIQQERSLSVRRAASAFVEARLPKERSISLLQKHWDLRRSEAETALQQAENRAKRG